MSFKTVRDVLQLSQDIHKNASILYEQLREQTQRERIDMLLKFLSRHEEELAQTLAKVQSDVSERILDEWHQTELTSIEAVLNGCKQCHGSVIKVNEDGSLDAETWPNTGMGRINPDGSKGACSACHSRHSFDVALARQPENCGKCHLGPDHPQKEIYEESKHGIAYYANIDRMNLRSSSWVVGIDYSAAPTCATCHMSPTSELPLTHDVGDRIS